MFHIKKKNKNSEHEKHLLLYRESKQSFKSISCTPASLLFGERCERDQFKKGRRGGHPVLIGGFNLNKETFVQTTEVPNFYLHARMLHRVIKFEMNDRQIQHTFNLKSGEKKYHKNI